MVFDSIETTSEPQLKLLNEKLKEKYTEDSAIENEEYLSNLLNLYEAKSFAGTLARDFENNGFKEEVKLDVSFPSKEREDTSGKIRVEEWHFKD